MATKLSFQNLEESANPKCPHLNGLLEGPSSGPGPSPGPGPGPRPCSPVLLVAFVCAACHCGISSHDADIAMPCHCRVQAAAPQAPQAPWEGSGEPEPVPPPHSPGSLIQRPEAALLNDLGQGHSAPYSIHSRFSFVLVGNCPWEELKRRQMCSRSPAQAVPASVSRGRETYHTSHPCEDSGGF